MNIYYYLFTWCHITNAEQRRHLNKYTKPDLINLWTSSLKGKKEDIRAAERKTNRMLRCGLRALQI